MAEHHYLIKGGYNYPIGTSIRTNIPVAKEMGENLLFFIDEHYNKAENVYLICRGSSGAIISAIVAEILCEYFPDKRTEILHVQKEGEYSHRSNYLGEYLFEPENVTVIIDDFVGSGNTINNLLNSVRKESKIKTKLNILCVANNVESYNFHKEFEHIICGKI